MSTLALEKADPAPAGSFDATWYRDSYPLAQEEIGQGLAADLEDHYNKIGRYRGYLPSKTARRPNSPAAHRSKFGGLWADQGNASDLINARFELGRITAEQAELLRNWVRDGYVILKNAIPAEILDRGADELDKTYEGKIPGLLFNTPGVGKRHPWSAEVQTKPSKAMDLHWLSQGTRDLIFSPPVLEFIQLVFDRKAFATQTLGFWRGSAQDAHQDSAYVQYSLPMHFVASWIALEDVSRDSGELFYYVGSHQLPDFLYRGEFKAVEEYTRTTGDKAPEDDLKRHVKELPERSEKLGFRKERFLAKRGDALIWSADLAHGGSPISQDHTRKSVVTHYCPAEIVPAYFEHSKGRRIPYRGGVAYYSSNQYRFDPR